MRRRLAVFAALCLVLAGFFVGYLIYRQHHRANLSAGLTFIEDAASVKRVAGQSHVIFVNTTFDEWNNRVAVAPLDHLDGPRFMTSLKCERVYSTGPVGMCLVAQRRAISSYYAVVFDAEFHERARFPLPGTPSRTRISPDGHFAATTVFVAGDSYAADKFSTRTSLFDLERLTPISDLEALTVTRDGHPWRAADFNFWGVTFSTEPGVFFATLASGGQIYLVKGRVQSREMDVIDQAVECPSLSPDGLTIAFKLRKPGVRLGWRLETVSLSTRARTPLSETRSVDDQAEWLDATNVLYSLPAEGGGSDVWSTNAGAGNPTLFLKQAYSPSIVRQ